MSNRIKGKNKVYNVSYHIVWIPKYRKKILVGNIKKRLIFHLKHKAKSIQITIKEMEIMPDHVHLFVKSGPTLTISFIVKSLKGYTSFMLRKEFPFLKKYKSLWTHSYFCETIGFISEKTVRKYIQSQNYKN